MHEHPGDQGRLGRRLGDHHLLGRRRVPTRRCATPRRPTTHRTTSCTRSRGWDGVVRAKIPQPAHTYAVTGIMNEHQLAIGETTFDGREELENGDGGIAYWTLMQLALQRARTAREAITVMTDLVAEYGYRSTGESFSIADPHEAWIMEMIGPGKGGKGALWVAVQGAGRDDRGPRQQVAHRHLPARRPGELPLLSQRHRLRDREGVLRPEDRRAVPLLRRLLPGHGAEAALHRDPRLVDLPPRRTVARAVRRLQPRRARRQPVPAVDQARPQALRPGRRWR